MWKGNIAWAGEKNPSIDLMTLLLCQKAQSSDLTSFFLALNIVTFRICSAMLAVKKGNLKCNFIELLTTKLFAKAVSK